VDSLLNYEEPVKYFDAEPREVARYDEGDGGYMPRPQNPFRARRSATVNIAIRA